MGEVPSAIGRTGIWLGELIGIRHAKSQLIDRALEFADRRFEGRPFGVLLGGGFLVGRTILFDRLSRLSADR